MKKLIKNAISFITSAALLFSCIWSGLLTFAEDSAVTGISLTTKSVIENTHGFVQQYYNSETQTQESYWCYYVSEFVDTVTVSYDDGTSISGTRSEIYNITGEWVNFDDNQLNEHWGIGDHTATASFLGVSCEFTCTVIENPVASISAVAGKTVVEGTHGYENSYYNQETQETEYYWCYNVNEFNPVITVNYKDGTSVSGTEYEIYNKTGESVSLGSNQNNEHWGIGDHTATASFLGVSCEFTCTVIENPVASISAVAGNTVMEGTHGYENSYYNQETHQTEYYWYYHVSEFNPIITVNYKDGTSISGTESEIREKTGESVSLSSNQNYGHWVVGENTATANFMGASCEFTCIVTESPVASISAVAGNTVIEGTHGYEGSYYNQETQETEYYWYYHVSAFNPVITVNYKDGTSISGTESEIREKTGELVSLSSNQNNEHWGVGENTATASFLGVSCEFICTVTENPVASISAVAGKTVVEGTHGYEDSYYNQETQATEYYWYYYVDEFNPIITVNYKDGTSISGTQGQIYNKTGEGVSFDGNQYNEHWGVGENTATASFMGVSCEFTCTVTESPVESISAEVEPFTEKSGGYYSGGVYHYSLDSIKATLKIKYRDGNTDTAYYSSNLRYYKGYYIAINFDDWNEYYSEEKHITLGENNTLTFSYKGRTCTAQVTLLENPAADYEYIEQDGAAYITGYMGTKTQLDIPDTLNGLPVNGISSLNNCSEITSITVPDSVKFISADAFYDCRKLKNIRIGSSVAYIDPSMFAYCTELQQIRVGDNNPNYCDIWGVLYSKDKTKIIAYPLGMGDSYTLPETVTDIEVLSRAEYQSINFTFSNGNSAFTTVDGVTYTSDMKTVVSCDREKQGEYIMPDTVTSIAVGAFSGCDGLTSVKFSDSVTDIAYQSFLSCSSLTSVELPKSLKSISDSAFFGSGLTSLTLPNGTQKVGNGAFDSCPIETLDLGNSLISVGGFAFYETKIKELNLPDTLSVIGSGAFSGTDITSLTLPDSLTSLGGNAFSDCDSLKTLSFGNGLEEVSESCFSDCNSLQTVNFSDSVNTIGSYTFINCTSLENIVFSKNLKTIKNGAFYECSAIKTLNLPEKLEFIGDSTFYNCSSITELVIPASVKELGRYSFGCCEALSKVTAQSADTQIPYSAFYGCPVSETVFYGTSDTIGAGEFSGKDFDTVKIPDTVTKIAYGAFWDCRSLSEIECPDSVISINSYAFDGTAWYNSQYEGCVYLGKVLYDYKGVIQGETTFTVDKAIKGIGDYAFDDVISNPDSGMTEVILPEGLEHIGKGAFRDCTAINKVYIPKTVSSIGYLAFAGCSNLTEIVIDAENPYYVCENGVVYTKDKSRLVFCSSAISGDFTVPSSVREISAFAFAGCNDITSIKIPSAVNTLENYSIGFTYIGIEACDISSFGEFDLGNSIYCSLEDLIASERDDGEYHDAKSEIQGQAVKLICVEDSKAHEYAKKYGFPTEFMIECNHNYISVITEPACIEGGYTTHTCDICGDSYTDSYTPAAGHHYSESYTVISYPTCTQDGAIARKCDHCDEITDIITVEPNGHTVGRTVTVQSPTCTQPGIVREYCSVCNELICEKETPASHWFGLWGWKIEPTENSQGVKSRVCEDCGAVQTVMAENLDNKGDLNGDGALNVKDLICMKKVLTYQKDYVPEADMSGDNTCSSCDFIMLRKRMLKIR